MNQRSPLTVTDIGEQGLLARLQQFCPPDVVGDDAALLTVQPHQALVMTTDVLVDGVHFSDRTTSAADVGWRAAAANLSDLAAMGATPLGITVGLSLPGETSVTWLEQLYEGMAQCVQRYGAAIVGGDVCRSSVLTVAIAAVGQVLPNRAIRRSLAQPGDAILVTGVHGVARAGLELLLQPASALMLREAERQRLIQAHQRPVPRFDVLPLLESVFEAVSAPYRVAGMDSSDGLADAVLQLCRASGVGARLDRDRISTLPAVHNWLSAEQALEWALYGGEDFELVLCLTQQVAEAVVKRLGTGAAIVGTIAAGNEVILTDRTETRSEQLNLQKGFQHF
ncbi:thiamine-phosphate kinase [Oculatella sp. LEGE 06141]|uniref:thiamine-phosphate kinase n=1 Tax=Oculatella sp. LEGE 06141 TaxID=1828648 RepID=UPI0018827B35|nr:thiamine-phosphate kinase [Oculatella sp. LEGE 06141]